MKLLAIDTTEAACSAALLLGGDIHERFELAPRQHSRLLLPMLDELLAEAGMSLPALDGLAFACGPGSFTGVRIAAAVVQGMAVAADLPVVPVSSLLALAQGAARQHQIPQVLAGFDARMDEVYWLACRQDAQGLMQAVSEAQVSVPQQLELPSAGEWFGAGSAWLAYADKLQACLGTSLKDYDANIQVHAQDVARLAQRDFAQAVPAEQALPVYLRNQVAHKKP